MNRSFWARFVYFEVNGVLVVGSPLNALLRHAAVPAQPLLVSVTRLLCTETRIYEAQKAGGEKPWSRRHCIHSSLRLLFRP